MISKIYPRDIQDKKKYKVTSGNRPGAKPGAARIPGLPMRGPGPGPGRLPLGTYVIWYIELRHMSNHFFNTIEPSNVD